MVEFINILHYAICIVNKRGKVNTLILIVLLACYLDRIAQILQFTVRVIFTVRQAVL